MKGRTRFDGQMDVRGMTPTSPGRCGLRDLTNLPRSGRFYGGASGRKVGVVIDGDPWMVKFARPHVSSRAWPFRSASDPVAEHIGCSVYGIAGIPSQETMLAMFGGEIVCACRDFVPPGGLLVGFDLLKNSVPDDAPGFSGVPSDGRCPLVGDALAAIRSSDAPIEVESAIGRFWDMLVVDAVLDNPGRDNSNWGFLRDRDGALSVAPVYSCGASLAAVRGCERPYPPGSSFYRNPDGSRVVLPDFVASCPDRSVSRAVERVARAIDMAAVEEVVDSIPDEAAGVPVLPADAKRAVKEAISEGLGRILLAVPPLNGEGGIRLTDFVGRSDHEGRIT